MGPEASAVAVEKALAKDESKQDRAGEGARPYIGLDHIKTRVELRLPPSPTALES